MRLPQLQIQSTPARIGIESQLGQYQIRRGQTKLNVETTPTVIDIKTERPELIIDQSKTWDAITGGKPDTFWKRIYSSYEQYPAKYIEKTVREYDAIGDLTAGGNPIAELARQSLNRDKLSLNVYGHATARNVEFDAVISKPDVNVQPGKVNIIADTEKPEIEYHRGTTQIYMKQYASVTITPPIIDLAF